MKGLLVIPEMARAILRDVDPKTNTRRVIVPQPTPGLEWTECFRDGTCEFGLSRESPNHEQRHSDYQPGERRCLLTTWATLRQHDGLKPTQLPDDVVFWHAGMKEAKPHQMGKLRPGRFLPNRFRHYMPIVEIMSVRAERVQDITTADIIAEGVTYPVEKVSATQAKPLLRLSGDFPPGDYLPRGDDGRLDFKHFTHENLLRAHWCSLWDSINHERGFGWAANPWVWRVEFRRVAP
jgi:hypothetical protein